MSVRTPDWNGPGTGFIITDTVAYVDSIALFRRGRFPELGQLRRKYGKRIFVKPCGEPGQAPYGALLTIHQPDVSTLSHFLAQQKAEICALSGVHLAVDFPSTEPERVHVFLRHSAVQNWHRQGHRTHQAFSTAYWNRDNRAARNIALYADRPSKPGGGACCHLEMRFTGADAVKRSGIDLSSLIAGPNVADILNRQMRIGRIDEVRFHRALERRARRFLPRMQRRRPGITIGEVKTEIAHRLARALQDEGPSS